MTGDIQGTEPIGAVERPRGIYTARVDNKGRLKLPSAFQKYLESLKEKNFFVTTTNETVVYIYPLPEWKKKEDSLDNPANEEQVEVFEQLRFVADKYGADAAVDGEGRMLLPQLLRETFKMQDAPVWLAWRKNVIEVMNEDEFRSRERGIDKGKLARANTILTLKDSTAKEIK